MPSGNPLVSIVIPVYNGARYLAEAINSALAQTYSPCEIIVVNDGSTDSGATEKVARGFGEKIRYIPKPNGGVASALNCGIKAARGEYVSWLSHDDVYYPYKIEEQVRMMMDLKKNAVLFSDYDIIDENSHFIQREYLQHVQPSRFRIALIAYSPVNGCTCLIPMACFKKAGYFDESLKTTQDNDLWFRMSETIPFVHMRRRLIKSRIHPGQGSFVIPGHEKEKREYYLRCIRSLADTTPSASRAVVFARLAAQLKMYWLEEYSRMALDICRNNMGAAPCSGKITARAISFYAGLFGRRFMMGSLIMELRSRLLRGRVVRYFASVKSRSDPAPPTP